MPPTSKSSSGKRLRTKFDSHISCKNFYEAHQLCNTLLFRFSNSANFDEGFELIVYSCNIFIDHKIFHSAFDLLHSYVNLLEKSSQFESDEKLYNLQKMLLRLSDHEEQRLAVMNSAIRKSKTAKNVRGSPILHLHFAKLYEEELHLQKARYHYVFSSDPRSCAKFCVKLSHAGLVSEVSLFPTQTVLQYLVIEKVEYAKDFLEAYVQCNPKIVKKSVPFDLPLLNFCAFLLIAIPEGNLDVFLRLTTTYEKSLKRDKSFAPCIEKIGVKYFGLNVPKSGGGGGLMGLIDSLFEAMGDGDQQTNQPELPEFAESEDEKTETNRDSKRIKISKPRVEESELD